MKKLIFCSMYVLLMLFTRTALTQNILPELNSSNILKVNILLPGISYERVIVDFRTFNFGIYLDGTIIDKSENANRRSPFLLTPTFSFEFRKYYNNYIRHFKGKRTAMNSANYIAPLYLARYSLISYFSDRILVNQVGAVWGIQRNYPKGFSLDLNAGLVYTFNAKKYYYYDPIELVIQAKIGFWLGKRTH